MATSIQQRHISGLRFYRNDQTAKVIKLFIIRHQQQLPFALFLQARNPPVGIIGYKHKLYTKMS